MKNALRNRLLSLSLIVLLVLAAIPAQAAEQVTTPLEARQGVVRILTLDNPIKPTWFSTGTGFAVGVVGEETAVFLTNRHVIWDAESNAVSPHVYIMLDENAVKRMYTTFGDFYDEDSKQAFKLIVNPDRLVECEVLYPSGSDPEFPDFAVVRAEHTIKGRYALPLLPTEEVQDASEIWTIGYPGSADKIYNTSSNGKEMFYSANTESAQLFTGTISRRGSLKAMGDTMALTHSAQIDHGNSGGPLVEESGRVLGINTYGFGSAETSSVGYYCSIFIDYAMEKLKELGIPFNVLPEDAGEEERKALEGGNPVSSGEEASDWIPEPGPGRWILSLKTKEVKLTKEGLVEQTFLYEYNEFGEWTSITKYNEDGSFNYRTEFILDDAGERIGERGINEDGSLRKWTEKTFDENGNPLTSKEYDEDGNLKTWWEYSYDQRGVRTSTECYSADGHYSKWTCDEFGRTVRYEYFRDDGSIFSEEHWEYEPDGSESQYTTEYDRDGNVTKNTLFMYDGDGNKTLYIYQTDNYYNGTAYNYDEDGHLTDEVEFDEEGNTKETRVYTYYVDGYECGEYDENGKLKAVEIRTEDDYGEGTFKYDLDGNLLDASKWIYNYNRQGYLVEIRYYSDEVLRSIYTFEPTEVAVNPRESEDYWDGKWGVKRIDTGFEPGSHEQQGGSTQEDASDGVPVSGTEASPAASSGGDEPAAGPAGPESSEPAGFEPDWYQIHQNYTGDGGSLQIVEEEDGVLSINVGGEGYTFIDSYVYTTSRDGSRQFQDFDGLTDVVVVIREDGKYQVTLTGGDYAGTYVEMLPEEAFEEEWFQTHTEFLAPGTADVLEVSVYDELFSLELKGMHLGSFLKLRYDLDPDGASAVYTAADRNGVTLTVTKAESYMLSVSGTDYDGVYMEKK